MLMDETVGIAAGDDALVSLDDIENPPSEVLAWASANWDGASTRLIGRLSQFSSGRRGAISGVEAFFIAHLSGEKGERRAYPVLCRLIGEDREIAAWLDDAVTETLPGILIRVFDGDTVLLRRAIESERGDAFARASALAALGYLVRDRCAMTDDDMRAFLRRIRRDMAPRRESVLWLTWASVVASLGYKDMRAEVASLKRDGFIPDGDFGGDDFDLRIALAQSDASGLAAFEYDFIAPLADATAAILSLAGAEAVAAGRRLRSFAATADGGRF